MLAYTAGTEMLDNFAEMSWFVEKVTVKETDEAIMEWNFDYNKWIEPNKKGKTEKQLADPGTK